MNNKDNIRNVAIIAHVDHGKTTLVDGMLKQSGIFRENQKVCERVMDSNELEKERGITILSKNTSVNYNGIRINIVDTPGHADFGGEVERIMKMVDGVLLLVDAFEGPMPQTRFVLRKALEFNIKPIVVINKIDRPEARLLEILDEVLELFIELGADEQQIDFPVLYASSRDGYVVSSPDDEKVNLEPLFKAIVDNIPSPVVDSEGPLQILVSSIDYDAYVGRIAIGRVERGYIESGQQAVVCKMGVDHLRNIKIGKLYRFEGIGKIGCECVEAGDIAAVSGVGNINIGDTICSVDNPEALSFIEIDQPTITMTFMVNDSPFAGNEGDYVTSRHLKERLKREIETNVSMQVEEMEASDSFKVSGRGELHISILIETMRRQGYEFQVSRPEVILRNIDGRVHEPIEYLMIDVSEEYMGVVMEKLGSRKAEMVNMNSASQGYMRLEFKIPARGLIGYRSEFLTDTRGNGIMNHIFHGYEPYMGELPGRKRGSIIAWENGEAVTYGLYNAQGRGTLLIGPGTRVYEGMVVGESSRQEDITVNVCKKKHVTNIRAAGADDALRLVPPRVLSLEQAIEFISKDEIVEVTPKSIRLRKSILDTSKRQRAKKQG